MSRSVSEYLIQKSREATDVELGQSWAQLDELHAKKLWHQLTESIRVFVNHPCFQNGGLVEFYHNFITDFEHKINPLSLVEICLVIVREMKDYDEALLFIESIKEKVKNDVESRVLCMVAIGGVKLIANKLDEVKEIMEEAGQLLDTIDGVTPVHGRYYDFCSEYSKIKGDHAGYYSNALKYLGCVDLTTMTINEKSTRAFCISIAALIGEGIYNFGELLVFRRQAHERRIDFSTIAEAAQIDINDVELLVMRGLSLGLVKGTIDEVDKQVNMTWVQPRVLDYSQVSRIKERVCEWVSQIKLTKQLMEDSAPELIIAN
ncbi:PREDICTED: 26S proteasome non-ATPase regulatory subunit 13-like [Amphimedon queenslandica]|uniref:26S proteasome non-ATPase regulatory subunit 13 n=1 Tax=Amphimedon queenslandica TaxID=400682 RepID=A0AAN0IZ96_AMPQE|nr:PREDICTED: 26S proteasome non-ATPase regulatory subunit 13-like [Amphimedon queenslandica]|eukprot:XP_019849776.1 PREDICTED: 26S proteasome non-ATPase regulatory subunit 13-like [Amphimedon queenslandica]